MSYLLLLCVCLKCNLGHLSHMDMQFIIIRTILFPLDRLGSHRLANRAHQHKQETEAIYQMAAICNLQLVAVAVAQALSSER